MRIRFVTPWYGEFAGGAEFAARKLAENLLKAGVDAGVLTTCAKTPFENWWTDFYSPGEYDLNGVKVLRFPLNKGGAVLYNRVLEKTIAGVPLTREDELDSMRGGINSHALISYIKKHRDLTCVYMPYLYGPTFWGVNAAPERSVMIPCLHDEAEARWVTIKDTFLKAKKVIFLSEEEKALAGRLYGKTMDGMPSPGMGVNTKITFNESRFREKYRIDGQFLVYAGRKVNGKNIELLIEYFETYLKFYNRHMKLVFIGGGDASLVPKDDARFVDLSFIPEQDKFDALSASVALCNLSINESFSFVIMESWLTGRPVIVSSKGIVTAGHCVKSGGGFAVSDAEEFCVRVHHLSRQAGEAGEMGSSGREYVLDNYSWDKVVRRYMEIFENIR
ncbi:MAG: glycosyltransferase family 4 protein [Deltaproteobacteria bacterium]|nr:glycosyltransferase family 4 protein [Deltaproteobacteria bacterium]